MTKDEKYYKTLYQLGWVNGETISPKEAKENKADPRIIVCGEDFIRVNDTDLKPDDFEILYKMKVLQLLGTIKKCAVFFTVFAAIGIAAAMFVKRKRIIW